MLSLNGTKLTSNLLLSPIAGYCDLAFRLSIRPLGGLGLAYTDLVNPRGLMRQTVKSMELIETEPGDRPLAVQLYGHEPDFMADAARWCTDHLAVAAIDINMGCPVDKVCKTRGGSALLRDRKLAVRLAEAVVRAVDVPVTVKMRLGWDPSSLVAPSLAAVLEDAGVTAITVHGRTAAQGFRGRACQDGIARVVEAAQRIPVIGNGDIRSPADALAMLRRTGCAGVMIGRAALADPWIFRDTHSLLTTGRVPPPPTPAERLDFIRTHFAHSLRIRGERRACITFRQRVSWYLKAIGSFPEWRERFRRLQSAAEFHRIMDQFPHPAQPPAHCS